MTAPAAATPQADTKRQTAGTVVEKGVVVEGTEYVIFTRDESGFWSTVDQITARTTEAAIRAHGKPGMFLAIPLRSFRPVTVKAETTTVLKIEAAK